MITDLDKHLTDQEFYTHIKFAGLVLGDQELEDRGGFTLSALSIGEDEKGYIFNRICLGAQLLELSVRITEGYKFEEEIAEAINEAQKKPKEEREKLLKIIWTQQFRNPFALKFWALENPAGHLQRFLGKPPFKFHPYDFGDRHSKETFIWGNFNLPKKRPVELNEEEIIMSRNNTRKLPPIPEGYVRDCSMRAVQIRRSITPQGFAEAFFKANQ